MTIRVPKVPFRVSDKLKNGLQKFIIRFSVLPQYEKRNSNN